MCLLYVFLGNFFQNFWSFLWHSFSEAVILYQIVKKPIIWYHIPSTFFSDIFTNYFQLHGLSQVSPQPTFYSDTYFFCLRNYTSCAHMTPQPTFFNDVFTTYLWPSCVSQFYSSTNVFKWRIHHLSLYAWNVPFLILNQTFFNDIFTTYPCTCGMSHADCPRYSHCTSLLSIR